MIPTRASVISVLLGCGLLVVGAHAEGRDNQLSCKGALIEPAAAGKSDKTVLLTLGGPGKVRIDDGSGETKARVVSDNQIQLKFRTKEFSGELFHYTNDLFLIYRSGHLARLTCEPRG